MRLVNFFLLLLIWGQPALANNFFPKPTLVKIHAPQKNREEAYQYGFNGKYKDNEWAGVGNHLDYGFRGYDSRTARFISVDLLSQQYPMLTPYQYASNTPIWAVDIDGLEAYFSTSGTFIKWGKNRSATAPVYSVDSKNIERQTSLNFKEFMDRAQMVYGEGGGGGINADGENPARYFAWAFENFKDKSGKEVKSEEDAKKSAWKDANHSYADGDIQTAGNSNSQYNQFNAARKDLLNGNSSKLDDLPNVANVIAEVLGVLNGTTTDPTGGAYQWIGGQGDGANNDTWNGKVSNRQATAKINTSTRWYKSFTVFYHFKPVEKPKKAAHKTKSAKSSPAGGGQKSRTTASSVAR
jgi:RHS repeat-associated protein